MLAFRHYNPDEIIMGKSMREHLKFAMSYWHTMCAEGSDMFGVGTISKNYGAKWYTCGAISKKGHPHHPLYLRADTVKDEFDIFAYLEKMGI